MVRFYCGIVLRRIPALFNRPLMQLFFIPLQLPDLPLGDVLNLLSNYFAIVVSDRKTTNSILKSIVFNELCICAATMVNKFPNKGMIYHPPHYLITKLSSL